MVALECVYPILSLAMWQLIFDLLLDTVQGLLGTISPSTLAF